MRRTYLTEANNKILRDWTHDKMLDIFKEKEKERIATELFIASQKMTSLSKTNSSKLDVKADAKVES